MRHPCSRRNRSSRQTSSSGSERICRFPVTQFFQDRSKASEAMRILRILACFLALTSAASAQWVNVQLPGIPRTPEGKPNLSAPAPHAADGKPDLSGIWMQVPLYGKDGYSDYAARPELTDEQYERLIAKPGTPTANLNQNLQFRTINGEEIPFQTA